MWSTNGYCLLRYLMDGAKTGVMWPQRAWKKRSLQRSYTFTLPTYMLGSVLTQVQTATLTIFVPYHHRLPTVYIR